MGYDRPMTPSATLSLVLVAVLWTAAPGPARAAATPPPAAQSRALEGESPEAVRQRLGEPDVAHGEGGGALWTYRLESCALMIAFRDTDRGLKVTSALAGPRRRGQPDPAVADCVAAAVAAHRQAADRPPPLPRDSTIGPALPPVPQPREPR